MTCGNASDFIDHPLPKHFVFTHGAYHHAWALSRPPSKSGADEPLLPDAQKQFKTYCFVPFVRSCMHNNHGVISGSHACRYCMWPIILDAELYKTCPGERVLVATRFNVTFLHLKH